MNGFAVFAIAFVTSAATAVGTVYVSERTQWLRPPAAQRVAVPGLVGLTETDARTNIEAIGLKAIIAGREPNAEAAAGTVLRQSPEVGQLAEPGQAVSLTFALEVPKVPDVIGKTAEEATKALEAAGYKVKSGEPVHSDDRAEGLVVRQAPEAGGALGKQGEVTLVVSAGSSEVEVPKLLGQSLNNAKAAAEKAKLKLAVQWVRLAETPSYVVLRQIPDPGGKVPLESEVKVVINRDD
jgi:serine/threonine-protein kinase